MSIDNVINVFMTVILATNCRLLVALSGFRQSAICRQLYVTAVAPRARFTRPSRCHGDLAALEPRRKINFISCSVPSSPLPASASARNIPIVRQFCAAAQSRSLAAPRNDAAQPRAIWTYVKRPRLLANLAQSAGGRSAPSPGWAGATGGAGGNRSVSDPAATRMGRVLARLSRGPSRWFSSAARFADAVLASAK